MSGPVRIVLLLVVFLIETCWAKELLPARFLTVNLPGSSRSTVTVSITARQATTTIHRATSYCASTIGSPTSCRTKRQHWDGPRPFFLQEDGRFYYPSQFPVVLPSPVLRIEPSVMPPQVRHAAGQHLYPLQPSFIDGRRLIRPPSSSGPLKIKVLSDLLGNFTSRTDTVMMTRTVTVSHVTSTIYDATRAFVISGCVPSFAQICPSDPVIPVG